MKIPTKNNKPKRKMKKKIPQAPITEKFEPAIKKRFKKM